MQHNTPKRPKIIPDLAVCKEKCLKSEKPNRLAWRSAFTTQSPRKLFSRSSFLSKLIKLFHYQNSALRPSQLILCLRKIFFVSFIIIILSLLILSFLFSSFLCFVVMNAATTTVFVISYILSMLSFLVLLVSALLMFITNVFVDIVNIDLYVLFSFSFADS